MTEWTHDHAGAALSCMTMDQTPGGKLTGLDARLVLHKYIEQQRVKDSARATPPAPERQPTAEEVSSNRSLGRGELVAMDNEHPSDERVWRAIEDARDLIRTHTAPRTQQRERAEAFVHEATVLLGRAETEGAVFRKHGLQKALAAARVVRP
jgi:hypothetical protein